jgi:hypothetical protein
MKTIIPLAVVGLAVGWSSASFSQAEQSNSQHDNMMAAMKKCAVCKYMAEKPELMKDMTWETHKIDSGMLSLTTVPKETKKEFDAVSAKMMQAIEKVKADMKQGKRVELCEYCAAMGELSRAGAKHQHIETSTGAIDMMTSNNPNVVKKIHALADKAIAEQKQMEQQPTTASLR